MSLFVGVRKLTPTYGERRGRQISEYFPNLFADPSCLAIPRRRQWLLGLSKGTDMLRVALLNDTSLFNNHFGCQLIGQAFREQFIAAGMDLTVALPNRFSRAEFHDVLSACDLVVVNGEGSIHHGRSRHLVEVARYYPTALVNCVFQENDRWPELGDLLYCAARESMSRDYLQTLGVTCDLVPDLLLASSLLSAYPRHPPSKDIAVTDNVTDPDSGPTPKTGNPAKYLDWLTDHQRVCAGRFHAAVAAARLGLPFSLWESNTWKTEGLAMDMGIAHLFFRDQASALSNTPLQLAESVRAYVADAPTRIHSMFSRLREIGTREARRRRRRWFLGPWGGRFANGRGAS